MYNQKANIKMEAVFVNSKFYFTPYIAINN